MGVHQRSSRNSQPVRSRSPAGLAVLLAISVATSRKACVGTRVAGMVCFNSKVVAALRQNLSLVSRIIVGLVIYPPISVVIFEKVLAVIPGVGAVYLVLKIVALRKR